ncbi:MAG: right-handed parallel beta-helix repeat-containing protein [Verrucomicrobia bacterium]|nr:right-handed parallel beta-helix repeat-containing protein [Verrucomicrobiota bacterium]
MQNHFQNLAGVVALALFGVAGSLRAAEYVVAQNHSQASDDHPGTRDRPWKTISKAAARVAASDTVVVHAGTYREQVLVKASGTGEQPIRFVAAPGDWVVVTGADRLTGWAKADAARPIFSVAWPHKFIPWNRSMTHPNDEYHAVIGRAEQVIVNGYLLRQVLDREQLAPGTFFADVTNRTLFAWDSANGDLNKAVVEASTRTEILRVTGEHVHVRGFRFRYAANRAQVGAITLAGRHDVLEDCVLEDTNAQGGDFLAADQTVRRCVFRGHGQFGFSANGAHRLLFTECLVEHNNTKNFERGWAAGGTKLVLCRDAVIEKSRFLRNRGPGVWFDIGNEHGTVRQCLIADNDDAGIFYEISYGLHAHDNVLVGNGFADTRGAWGAQAAICLSSSPGCVVERNLMAGNREGFNFREQLRTTPTISNRTERAVWNHDELIRSNLVVWNRDAQVAGWFAVDDRRHWPAATVNPAGASPAGRERAADLAADYVAKSADGQPQNLALEKLNLHFEGNVYFAGPGQRLFQWGPRWTEHKWFETVEAFRVALGLDRGGRTLEPKFADWLARDLRLAANADPALQRCYPQGDVPGLGPNREAR